MRKLFFQLVNQVDPARVLEVRACGQDLRLRDGESGALELQDHVHVLALEADAWPFPPGTAGDELKAIAISAGQLAGEIARAGTAVAQGELTVEAAAAIVLQCFFPPSPGILVDEINKAAERYTAESNARAALLEPTPPAPTETPPAEASSPAMVWTGKTWAPRQVES